MREILFRGKTLSYQSEWVEGFYNHIPCGRFMCDEHCIQTIKEDGKIGQLYNVYESTVGQYTGQLASDARLFEGDIFRYGDELMVVEWDAEGACFCCRSLDGTNWFTDFSEIHWDAAEIVGNIHDNPELLED